MNILYITHGDPRRTDFGSAQRSHLLWKALRQLGTVYTVYNVGNFDPDATFDEGERIAAVRFGSPHRFVVALNVLLSRFCAPVEWPFRSRRFILSRIPWKGVAFDCVVVRYLGTVAMTAAWKLAPRLYVDIDDLPTEAFATIWQNRQARPLRGLLRGAVGAWQRFMLRRCRGTWIANGAQVAEVAVTCPCRELRNLALAPSAAYARNAAPRRRLMTIGYMGYEPNWQGVDWFLRTCWPTIHERFPDLEYAVAGGGLDTARAAAWSAVAGVKVLGYVKDLEALYAESLAVVASIRAGAGTCIKVLEAALYGRAVLATPFAVRGLDAAQCDALGMTVSERPGDYVAALETLIAEDASARTARQDRIAAAAQALNFFDHFAQSVREAIDIICA